MLTKKMQLALTHVYKKTKGGDMNLIRPKELLEIYDCERSMYGSVSYLIENNLLKKVKSEGDMREVYYQLTTKGKMLALLLIGLTDFPLEDRQEGFL